MKKTLCFLSVLLVFSLMLSPACFAEEGGLPELGDAAPADAYLYCLRDGMPKYWLDLTGTLASDPVLHCYFRSSDPTFYESWFVLELSSAKIDGNTVAFRRVFDSHGLEHSDWFTKLLFRFEEDGAVMEVERDNSTLAGGAEDNILSGVYRMEAAGAKALYEYRREDGMRKYWLDLSGEEIALHAMFRSGEPEYYEEVFTLLPSRAEEGDGCTLTIGTVRNAQGLDVSDWFRSMRLTQADGVITMEVERDEATLAGGTEDNILSGSYVFRPTVSLRPAQDGPYTGRELARWAQIRYFTQTGFYPPRADAGKKADGNWSVHLYEIVNTDGVVHTATSAWYTVDPYGVGTDDIRGDAVRLAG